MRINEITHVRSQQTRLSPLHQDLPKADMKKALELGDRYFYGADAEELQPREMSFIGPSATAWDQEAYEGAVAAAEEGMDEKEIWQLYGTLIDAGGNVRQEISNHEDELLGKIPGRGDSDIRLGDLVNAPALFNSYPQARDIIIHFDPNAPEGAAASANIARQIMNVTGVTNFSTMMHEIQHFLDGYEGITPGLASKVAVAIADAQATGVTPWDIYLGSVNERAAREAARRLGLTPEERAELFPNWLSPDQPGPQGTEVNVWQNEREPGTFTFGTDPGNWNVEQIPGTTSPRDDDSPTGSRPNWPSGRQPAPQRQPDDPGVSGDTDTWHGGDLQPDGKIRMRFDDATGKWINIDANGNDIGIANRQEPAPGKPSSDDADKDTWHGGNQQPDGHIRQRYDDATGTWINIDKDGNDIGPATSAPPSKDDADKDTWHGGDLQPDGKIRQRYDAETGTWINIDAAGNDIGIANRQPAPAQPPSDDDADKDTWHGGDQQPDGMIRQRFDDATGKWVNIDAAGNDIGIANVQPAPTPKPKPDPGVSGDKDTWHGGDLQPDGKIRQRYDAATGNWVNIDAAGNDIGIANVQPAPAPKPEQQPRPIPEPKPEQPARPTPVRPIPGPKPSVDDFSRGGVFDPKPGLGNVEGIPKPKPSVDDFSRGGRFVDLGDVEGIPRPKKIKPIHKEDNDDPFKRMKILAGLNKPK